MSIGIDLGSSAVKVATAEGVRTMRGVVDPELSSRMGTTAPVVRHVGNALSLCSPHESYVLALSRVLGESQSPEGITVVVPDWWSQRAQDIVARTLTTQYPSTSRLVGAAPAAVRAFSSSHGLTDPAVAVLDVGATCTSATVVIDDGGGEPDVAGPPVALQGRGGDRLDALLLHHVLGTIVGDEWSHDPSDQGQLRAAWSFRDDIRVAKEQLSTRPVVRIVPHLTGQESELRLVRAEFDDVARPVISEIVGMLTTCIAESGTDVGAVLLVGGGAPTPLLTQVISAELGLPVLLDDEPTSAAARGAMRFGLDRSGRESRSRGRIAGRQGVRAGRRSTPRPTLAARIVTIPAPAPAPLPDEEIASPPHPLTDVAPMATKPAPEPAVPPKAAEEPMPSVAQFPPSTFVPQPPVSRHAAPLSDRVHPNGQNGAWHYRGRRRADADVEANEAEAATPDATEDEEQPDEAKHRTPR